MSKVMIQEQNTPLLLDIVTNLHRLLNYVINTNCVTSADGKVFILGWEKCFDRMIERNNILDTKLVEALANLNSWNTIKNMHSDSRNNTLHINKNLSDAWASYNQIAHEKNMIISDINVMTKKFVSSHNEVIQYIHTDAHNLFTQSVLSWTTLLIRHTILAGQHY